MQQCCAVTDQRTRHCSAVMTSNCADPPNSALYCTLKWHPRAEVHIELVSTKMHLRKRIERFGSCHPPGSILFHGFKLQELNSAYHARELCHRSRGHVHVNVCALCTGASEGEAAARHPAELCPRRALFDLLDGQTTPPSPVCCGAANSHGIVDHFNVDAVDDAAP